MPHQGGAHLKRRLSVILLSLLLISCIFALPVSADNQASKVELYCTINPDGDCLVSMNVTFHMETGNENLTFPLPKNAGNITMNGGAVGTAAGNDCILAQVGSAMKGMVGDFTVRFDYSVPSVVKVNENRKIQLDLPLINGFMYPVSNFSFVITFPGTLTQVPAFTSTYQQISFESNLDLVTKDNMLTGSNRNPLKDHEAVALTMVIPTSMLEFFPGVSTYQREGNPELIPMGILAGLALLYWLIFLRNLPFARTRSPLPPAGIGAGELGCRLTLTGGDLSMMVLSWAQLGYLFISLDGHGEIRLYKRMEMGNERSLFEVRVFNNLFAKHNVVHCSGPQYAAACQKTAAMIPGEKSQCRPHSGNRKVVRVLLCLAQVFCGICVAMNMTGIVALEWVLGILFSFIGVISAWHMQSVAFCMHRRQKTVIWVGSAWVLVWVVLGLIAKQVWIPLGACAVQLLFGWLIAFGGLRTPLNRIQCSEILGLKRYLRRLPKNEALRLQKFDPDYFFRMAPYAMAMGVGMKFAKAFGNKKLPRCPYFSTHVQGRRTAEEWMRLMQQSVSAMEARYRRNRLEKWIAIRYRK